MIGNNNLNKEGLLLPIDFKNSETCKAASDMLIARLNGNYYPENVVIKCDLKLRESTN